MHISKRIALMVPCYNEGLTIEKVVNDFRRELPGVEVYVYDNNSKDDTTPKALAAGATVRRENKQGKGNVVRRMFRDIDADIYIMVDGDDTYPAAQVKELITPVAEGRADMVIGDRLTNGSYYKENKRHFHGFGNDLVRNTINRIFRTNLKDIMTGYRVFSREFVKSFPAISEGFQVETEMTIFALNSNFRITEIPITFSERPEGSFSKLNTFSDGIRVLFCIFNMYRHNKPLSFFSLLALVLALVSVGVGIPVVLDYIDTGLVPRLPSAVLASGIFIVAVLVLMCGVILDTMVHNEKGRFEQMFKNR